MNHFHSSEFQHITLYYLTIKDILNVMLICKQTNQLVKKSSKFELGRKHYEENPILFHYYLDKIQKPITLEAYKLFLSSDVKNTLPAINNPIKHLQYYFIDIDKCIDCIWMFENKHNLLQYKKVEKPMLLKNGALYPIEYKYDLEHDEAYEIKDVVLLQQRVLKNN